MQHKNTLVLGASTNKERYSYKAVNMLRQKGYTALAVGNKNGKIADVPIQTEWPDDNDIHTISVYLRPELQKQYFEKIRSTRPKRLILNPGTENEAIKKHLNGSGIKIHENCTLVLLVSGQF